MNLNKLIFWELGAAMILSIRLIVLYYQNHPKKEKDDYTATKYRCTEITAPDPRIFLTVLLLITIGTHIILSVLFSEIRGWIWYYPITGCLILLFTPNRVQFHIRIWITRRWWNFRLFWKPPIHFRAGIQITQLPYLQKETRKDQTEFTRVTSSSGKSLLYNVESSQTWIGPWLGRQFMIRLQKQNRVHWQIYRLEKSRKKAQTTAQSLQSLYQAKFPGLRCEIMVDEYPYGSPPEDNRIKYAGTEIPRDPTPGKLFEVILPHPPYDARIPLIQNIAQFFSSSEENLIALLVFSTANRYSKHFILRKFRKKKLDPAVKREIEPLWVGQPYRLQILVKIPDHRADLVYQLRSLCHQYQNWGHHAGKLKPCAINAQLPIFGGKVTRNRICTPWSMDFHFDYHFLSRAKACPNRHLMPETIIKPELETLDLGWVLRYGVKTKTKSLLPIANLTMNMLIAGSPGVGKSVLIQNILHQIQWKKPDVGILIINTTKRGEDQSYPGFDVIHYGGHQERKVDTSDYEIYGGTEQLQVVSLYSQHGQFPYALISENGNPSTMIKQVAKYITAVMGLLEFTYRFFYTPLLRYYQNEGCLPADIREVFALALRYLDTHPYADREQQNIRQAIEMRGRELVEDPLFIQNVTLSPEIPAWLDGFLHQGKKIFVDLSKSDTLTQKFLILAILNMVAEATQDRNYREGERLQNLLVFDEAHGFLSLPDTQDGKSDQHVRQMAIQQVIRPYLLEYRSRGIGTLIADQKPSLLLPVVRDQTAIKVLFRVGSECAKIYSPNPELQEFVMQQSRYRAVVMDGSQGELYQIKTNKNQSDSNLIPHKSIKIYKKPSF